MHGSWTGVIANFKGADRKGVYKKTSSLFFFLPSLLYSFLVYFIFLGMACACVALVSVYLSVYELVIPWFIELI